jgi:hypothetical protein
MRRPAHEPGQADAARGGPDGDGEHEQVTGARRWVEADQPVDLRLPPGAEMDGAGAGDGAGDREDLPRPARGGRRPVSCSPSRSVAARRGECLIRSG